MGFFFGSSRGTEPRRATGRRPSRLGAALAACMALAWSSCASLVGEADAETKFLIKPKADGTFWGWSEITISEDASSAERATLLFVTLELMDPSQGDDLTFLEAVEGEAVTPDGATKLAEKSPMPKGESIVTLDVLYDGDLRPFFTDGHTIRIEWRGRTNPAFTAWPKEGYWIKVLARVAID